MIHSPGKTSPNCEIAILDVVYQPTSDNGPPTPEQSACPPLRSTTLSLFVCLETTRPTSERMNRLLDTVITVAGAK